VTTSGDLQARLVRLLEADKEALRDPYSLWNEARERSPVVKLPDATLLLGYDDVRSFLANGNGNYSRGRTRHTGRFVSGPARFTDEERKAWNEVNDFDYLKMRLRDDPDDHARLRKTVHMFFTPRRVAELSDRITSIISERMEPLANEGWADVRAIGYQIPLLVIAFMLGVPIDDLEEVHGWTGRIALNKGNVSSGPTAMEARAALQKLEAYVGSHLEMMRHSGAKPGLVECLLEAHEMGRLSDSELIVMFTDLLFAGHETSAVLIVNGMRALLGDHRAQWDRLVSGEVTSQDATEELLRFVAPGQLVQYSAARSHKVSGTLINEGETVVAVLASANRDPSMFPDPDHLDLGRPNASKHMSFGFGAHFCVGASLARLEVRIFLEFVAREYPNLQLIDEPLNWDGSVMLRAPTRLRVAVGN
jgi:cytochrome P450